MYSKRRPHLPPQPRHQHLQRTVPAGVHAADALRPSTPGAQHGMLPFKRCKPHSIVPLYKSREAPNLDEKMCRYTMTRKSRSSRK